MIKSLSNSPVWLRLILSIGALLIAVGTTLVVWVSAEQKRMALDQSHEFAESVNQMTMAALVFMKTTKTVKRRAIYLDQVKRSSGIADLRIVRADPVINQFGDGDEDEMRVGPEEKLAIESGKPFFDIRQDPSHGKVLKAVFPAVSQKNYLGKDCTECHDEYPAGTVLGAVTMEISLDHTEAEIKAARTKLIGGVALAFGIVLLCVFWFLQRFVSKPLNAMAHRLSDIADGEGDLTQRLPVGGEDEVGQAASSFNRMMEKLQAVIRNVSRSAEDVSEAASSLQAGTMQIRDGAGEQSKRSLAAASAVEKMVQSILEVDEASKSVLALSRASLARAKEGNEDVSELTDRLQDVESAVSKITKAVETFIQHTQSISSLTAQVKGIADQTNLLALNAAIEAARAGEHGRGFAVVADEVRKLAEKSTRSASDIDEVTSSLNAGSEHVRTAINEGSHALQLIRESMLRVAEALENGMTSASGVADGMNEIAIASTSQRTASNEAAHGVETIADLAKQTSHSLDDIAVASERLEHLSTELHNEIRKFKV